MTAAVLGEERERARVALSDRAQPIVAGLCALVIAGMCVRYLLVYGVTPRQLGADAAYWLLAVLAPGWLVVRAIRGAAQTWIAELSLAASTGLALELAAWMLMSLAGLQRWLFVWPVLALLVLALPGGRARVRERPTARLGIGSLLALTVCTGVLIRYIAGSFFRGYQLPFAGSRLYPDMVWHMGLAEEAKRSFPLGTPQVVSAGDLKYHWFSNAHIAAESLISGVEVPTLLMRLYILPLSLIAIGLSVTVAHWLSGRAMAGGLAGSLTALMQSPSWWPRMAGTTTAWTPLSPSQMFAFGFIAYFAFGICVVLRHALRAGGDAAGDAASGVAGDAGSGVAGEVPTGGTEQTRPPRRHTGRWAARTADGGWPLVLLGGFAIVGAKASAPPTLLAGVLAAAVVLVLRRRRAWPTALGLVGWNALVLVVCVKLTSGGDAGSGYQLLSVINREPYYKRLSTGGQGTGPVISGLVHVSGVGLWMLAGVAVYETVRLATVLIAVSGLVRPLRMAPEAWLFMGCCGAALVPYFVIDHQGMSELYFTRGITGLAAIVTAWAFGELLARRGAIAVRRTLAIGAGVLGLVVSYVVTAFGYSDLSKPFTRNQMLHNLKVQFTAFVLVVAAVLVLAVLIGLVGRRRGVRGLAPLAVLSLVLGALFAQVPYGLANPSKSVITPVQAQLLSQAKAARWIRAHVPENALMASNDQCRNREALVCDARVWWVSGLGGRRVLVEGWSYVPASANKLPFFDPALWQANQAAYTTGSRQDLNVLAAKGVRDLVVVKGKTSVAPAFWANTHTVFRDGDVAVVTIGK